MRHQPDFQVFRGIIRLVSVFVMYLLPWLQWPTKLLLHHQPAPANVFPFRPGKGRVLWHPNICVTNAENGPPGPVVMLWPTALLHPCPRACSSGLASTGLIGARFCDVVRIPLVPHRKPGTTKFTDCRLGRFSRSVFSEVIPLLLLLIELKPVFPWRCHCGAPASKGLPFTII